ncbi:NAD(P)H-flavin reductase [Billgrantia pellis]|uniref:NAD(P)H-flavin reductase n=1 Tax=Billgrantia pellis TaxID=2606936 RepID=A0A7V7KG21_9GAMM|nr:NAD(P)H-flavin reductase [Halomonas pellis]KAA0012115.1 NAD(P)H-flavin reductase [Halomonas pellis]
MTPRTLTCQITAVEDLTPDVFRVYLEGRPEAMAHAPGQYLELKLDDDIWVPFSIANAHTDDGTLELHIQHWPERENSARLRELMQIAERLTLRLPGGDCVLDETSRRPLLLIAAGTGFAQMKAIVEASLREAPEREIDLWWAARERRDLYLESLPREWAGSHDGVRFHLVTELTPETPVSGERIQGHLGRIDQALAAALDDVSGHDVYLSGSPGMVYACVDVLASLGLESSRVFSDVFAYAPRQPLVPITGVLRRGSAG